jgi:2-polyprenyl-3-methyl-5-hydroxy-6-metoxy-1,4-benzoquinol methylase
MSLAPIHYVPAGQWEHALPRRCLIDRDEVLLNLCNRHRVLHVGAADAPFHLEKAAVGGLLHQKLKRRAMHLVGLDTNGVAVSALKEKYAITDILQIDITQFANEHRNEKFDVILCCDVIEHLTDFDSLLKGCKRLIDAKGRLVLSTINATALKPALRAVFSREAVHPDHTSYFSYATLIELLRRYEFRPMEVGTFLYPGASKLSDLVFRTVASKAPFTADGILIIATL